MRRRGPEPLAAEPASLPVEIIGASSESSAAERSATHRGRARAPGSYIDDPQKLLVDLRDLSARSARAVEFNGSLHRLAEEHSRKSSTCPDRSLNAGVVRRRTPPNSLQWPSDFLFVSFAIPFLSLSGSCPPMIAARETRNASDDLLPGQGCVGGGNRVFDLSAGRGAPMSYHQGPTENDAPR